MRQRRLALPAIVALAALALAPAVGSAQPAAEGPLEQLLGADEPSHTATAVDPAVVGLAHRFTSSTGWVKPGAAFPLRTFATNGTDAALTDVVVTIQPAPSMRFVGATPLGGAGTATVAGDGTVRWEIPTLAAAGEDEATELVLVTDAVASSLIEDPEVAWKDLSTTATLSGGGESLTSTSHGPKVIPPTGGFESARYGDKPFPVVTVAYADRPAREESDTALLDTILNSPDFEGSTLNLYQEMSFGQLFPEGRVPSSGIPDASYDDVDSSRFSSADRTGGDCRGVTLASVPGALGSPAAPSRIVDGWYQLPGDTEYYGGDFPIFPYGALVGAPQPYSIDSACGPTGKVVYDAAVISDPEIDFNDFDSDRDGVVDFFMIITVGCGGNGGSQLGPAFGCPDAVPYDNSWPHSSSLEFDFSDPETGLRGYVSADQLRSVREVPQCYLALVGGAFDDCAANGGPGDDSLPVPVRVGPYNVNPEDVFESASVISHEYGHHLGLPDFYNSGGFDASGTFELMASDYSQHMTVFSKQDMGWIVPQYLEPGEVADVNDWSEIKTDTGEIHWFTPDGTPYTLSAANGDQNIHNGEAYAVRLPGRITITDELFETGGSAPYVFHSGRGNDFGCPPTQGHALDLWLPDLADMAGSTVELRFQSAWDIEWDWDYGFVMATTDGENYAALESANGYSTPSDYNPNTAGCLTELGNGLTGSSAAYEASALPLAFDQRVPASEVYNLPLTFVEDSYDLSSFAGEPLAIRFGYFTDPAFERPGWFIDDIEVIVDGEVLFSSNADEIDHTRLFPGGCTEDGGPGPSVFCTVGWTRLGAGVENTLDHAYYLELRDRIGFDEAGHGQSDRGEILWDPGVFVQYTDENWGYGNNALSEHPAQHYLDSTPEVGADCPASAGVSCHDSAFTADSGRRVFSDSPSSIWTDGFEDSTRDSGNWEFDFGCLDLVVESMSGNDTIGGASDLVADATITAGDGCVTPSFVSGAGVTDVADPTAVIGARAEGLTVTFDGSGSFDDATGPSGLSYAWNFGDGATGTGQVVRHSYGSAGSYVVSLTVTDGAGRTDTETATVEVAADGSEPTPIPSTGGGLALLGLLSASGALVLRRR